MSKRKTWGTLLLMVQSIKWSGRRKGLLIKRDHEADLEAKVVIIATGASAITLPLPSKKKN